MPNYCTVCGVKLTAKNKISYRPSSCRDCELERKRLYSLKKKIENDLGEKTTKAASAKTVKPKAGSATKSVKEVKGVAAKSKKEAVPAAKNTSKSKETKVEKTVTKLSKSKELAKKKEAPVKELPKKESKLKSKEKETEKLNTKKTVELVAEEKTKEVKSAAKPEKEKKTAKAITKSKPDISESKGKKTKELTKKTKASKEEEAPEEEVLEDDLEDVLEEETAATPAKAKSTSAPLVIPSYIKEAAKTKVKKRRLAKIAATKSKGASSAIGDSQSDDASEVFALGKNLTEEDLLRAPSDTPWESSSFKIVDGSFVEHGAEDQDEVKGPSPEEIKNIIERIRLEHKTRRG